MFPFLVVTTAPPRTPSSNAARAVARSSRSMPRQARRCGSPTRSPMPSRSQRTPSARSCGVRRACRSGRRQPSILSSGCCTSAPATTIRLPATATSDAVLALSLDTGKIVWTKQLLTGDMGNAGAPVHGQGELSGAAWSRLRLGHVVQSDYLGQREVPADHRTEIWDGVGPLPPHDSGRVVWSTGVGTGGVLGGVECSCIATDGKRVYAAVSDIAFTTLVLGKPLVPIRQRWRTPCTPCRHRRH